jgi:wobble nucleotide-excising tRNase
MSQNKIHHYKKLSKLAIRLRDDLNSQDFVLLYAYNGTGKTRLSMEFKDRGKRQSRRADTLYFNAFTEDLFSWENDLANNSERYLKINANSSFFNGLRELALEPRISNYLSRYANFDYQIDYDNWRIIFSKGDTSHIKVSRGEENIFIWCIFLAICEVTLDDDQAYNWVKYLYIDDPISSLDDNNAIAVASDLAKLLKRGRSRVKTVISSHHGLFFNIMYNELKKHPCNQYFLHKNGEESYTLQKTNDTPFFHHVALLSELKKVSDSGNINTYHFNMLRSILEKTSKFFGFDDFSACIYGIEDEVLYARALNLLSHGDYSIYQPVEMGADNKALFRSILEAFLTKYRFELPQLLAENTRQQPSA